jgi:dipeptidyl-peptidase-4
VTPKGTRVAYRRGYDLYVEDISSGSLTRLTEDGSRTIINGTFDWVYEEEFDARDGFRWSPDGRWIAYWQLDAEGIREFDMINNTDSLYSYTIPVQYPKAGERNSAASVGVVSAAGGETAWFDVPGDLRDNYIPRMEWAGNSDEIVIQRMNRLQNTNTVMLGDVATGAMTPIRSEQDEAWVNTVDEWEWIDGGQYFIWTSETTGFRHVYRVSRDGKAMQPITFGGWDVISIQLVDTENGWLWFLASPTNATQRYLYRARLDGSSPAERVTPAGQPGVHRYTMSPNGQWAFHTWSQFGVPPVTELVSFPDHQTARTLVDNADLKATVAALTRGESEFFTVNVNGVELDGWMMKPLDIVPGQQYPMLVYGYTGPAGTTVTDAWGGFNYLWHLMLTQGRVGRLQLPVAPDAHAEGIHRRLDRQSGHSVTQGPTVPEGDLQADRSDRFRRPGGRRAAAAGRAQLHRSVASRSLGLERWRRVYAERTVPLPGALQSRDGRGSRGPREVLRHDLHGAVHGAAGRERRGL